MAEKTTFDLFQAELGKKAKEKGFQDFEVFFAGSKGFSVRVFKGQITEFKNSEDEGVGFRGTFEGKMGYAYSENMDLGVIDKLLENAAANAGIIEDPDIEKLYPGDEKYPEVNSFNEALNKFEAAQKIEWALEMEKYALSLDPRVKMADNCLVANDESAMAMANSYGLNLSGKQNRGVAFIVARAEENGITKSGMEYWVGRDFAEFDYKAIAKKAVDRALASLGAASIPSGEYKIILDTRTARSIFTVFSSVFIAERGQKGFSLLNKDRLGENIAAPHVTLRDDGITELSLDNRAFDAEGVASQNKAVVENGVLKTLLYNTKAAAKEGVKSTGNAAKQGFGGSVTTSVTNFYLVPGKKTKEELISGAGKALLITDLAGLHSGANPVSGDFSFSADGFLIEDGKISRPVEQITVAGNFYQLLKDIEEIGSDIEFGMGKVGMPSVVLSKLSVSGL
jgi:PmbA protein